MMKNKIKNKFRKYDYSIYAFFLNFIFCIIIFSLQGRLISGNLTFMHCDMLNQMIPFVKMFLRQLFIDHNIFYSFDFALGSATIPQYAFYACFNPLNLIMLLPLDINICSFVLVAVKLSLGAFAFHELSYKITSKKDVLSVALSLSYSLCGFNIAYYHVIIWLDGIYLLPIIIIFIIELLIKKKNPYLIIAYSILFIINFYTGYLVGIYTFAFFVLYLIIVDSDKKSDKLLIFMRYVLYVFLAIIISAIVLLPTAISIIKYSPNDALGFDETIINIMDLLKQFFIGQSVDEIGYYPYVYCGLFTFILFPIFLINKKVDSKLKVFFGLIILILTIFAVTKPGYKFIHAFNNPDNFGHRYAYLFVFTFLLMACIVRQYIKEVKRIIIFLICTIYMAFILVYSCLQTGPDYIDNPSNTRMIIAINIIFLLLYLFVFVYFIEKKYIQYLISSLLFFEIIIKGYIYKDMYLTPVYEVKSYFDYFYTEERDIFNELRDNNDIFRVYAPKTLYFNSPSMIGYGGVDAFSSIINVNLNTTMRNLGYRSNYLAMSEDGSTPLMRTLLGQNYYVFNNDLSIALNGDKASYLKAEALPIAYMSSRDILDYSAFGSPNPFENQNKLASALCGEKIDYFYNTGDEVDIIPNNVHIGDAIYNDEEVVGFEIEEKEQQAGYLDFVDYNLESEYAYFEMLESYSYLHSPILFNEIEGFYLTFKSNALTEPKIIEMKKTEDGSHVYIIMTEDTDDKYYFKVAYFYGTHTDELNKTYDILSNQAMNVEMFRDGYVKGRVNSTEEKGILFTTIPYEDGWDVFVDGEKKETISLVDNTFLGVEVPEGEHEIEFKFTDRWAVIGGVFTSIGVLFGFVVFCVELNNRKSIVVDERESLLTEDESRII